MEDSETLSMRDAIFVLAPRASAAEVIELLILQGLLRDYCDAPQANRITRWVAALAGIAGYRLAHAAFVRAVRIARRRKTGADGVGQYLERIAEEAHARGAKEVIAWKVPRPLPFNLVEA